MCRTLTVAKRASSRPGGARRVLNLPTRRRGRPEPSTVSSSEVSAGSESRATAPGRPSETTSVRESPASSTRPPSGREAQLTWAAVSSTAKTSSLTGRLRSVPTFRDSPPGAVSAGDQQIAEVARLANGEGHVDVEALQDLRDGELARRQGVGGQEGVGVGGQLGPAQRLHPLQLGIHGGGVLAQGPVKLEGPGTYLLVGAYGPEGPQERGPQQPPPLGLARLRSPSQPGEGGAGQGQHEGLQPGLVGLGQHPLNEVEGAQDQVPDGGVG